MHFFYGIFEEGEIIGLDEEEAKHASVLRLKIGEHIGLQDGQGRIRIVEHIASDKKNPKFKLISSQNFPPLSPYIHLAISLIKDRERMEWLIEKATELGVAEITPLLCDHTEKSILKKERWDKIINSAFKQSGRAWRPVLNELTSFKTVAENSFDGFKCIASQHGKPIQTVLKQIHTRRFMICIGPEGDFSESELLLAKKQSMEKVSFGNFRLRSETAGMVAVMMATLLDPE